MFEHWQFTFSLILLSIYTFSEAQVIFKFLSAGFTQKANLIYLGWNI
jgi:hypothetical protein